MKKKLLLVLLTISIPFAMAACSKKEAPAETLPSDEIVETPMETQPAEIPEGHTDEAVAQMTDEEIINECLALLGKNDDESAKTLDGGEQNYSADGEFLIGRNYNVVLFGGETMIGTSYSEAGITNSITVELKGNDADFYKVELTELFGEPIETVDTPSEAGAVYDMWEKDGKQVYLYVMEDMCTLQFTLPEK